MSKRYLIVGCGAAAWSAAQAIRSHDLHGSVTLVSAEAPPPYARTLLSYWLEGKVDEEVMYPFPTGYFEGLGVELLHGQATATDTRRQVVTLANGRELPWDELLMAMGASPSRPPIAGLDLRGVFNLWTLEDVRGILAAIRPRGKAVIIGGGLIGMQAVDALAKRGMSCTVVEMLPQVLARILDAEGARLMEAALRKRGVQVLTSSQVAEIRSSGQRKRVALNDGRSLLADLVISAAGIQPNLALARSAGLETATGILVDDRMRTSDPHIYAAGDVAEGRDIATGRRAVHAIWPTAVEQGQVAGLNMAGMQATYPGSLSMNALEVLGLSLASAGLLEDGGLEFRVHRDSVRGVYRKLAFRDGRLVGAVLIGELGDMGLLQAMIRQQADLTRWKESMAQAPLNLGKTLLTYGAVRP